MKLSPEEDGELRRLHALAQVSTLSEFAQARYDDLRVRDQRSEVREPNGVAVPLLVPRVLRDYGPAEADDPGVR